MSEKIVIKMDPFYNTEDLKRMYEVKTPEALVAELEKRGIPYEDQGKGRGRKIKVWATAILNAAPSKINAGRYKSTEDYFNISA